MLKPSEGIKAFVKGFEQFRDHAFKPTPNDVWTIAWGRTAGVKAGDTCTREQGDTWFDEDMDAFAAGVWAALGGALTAQHQFDAMVSLAYNIGLGNFRTCSVRTNHIAGHYSTAALAFSLWNKQMNTKTKKLEVLDGLTRRRSAEAEIYKHA